MSARPFCAMQIWSFSRIAGVGNWARSMAAMRDASVSGAAETWRGIRSVICLYFLLFCYEDHPLLYGPWTGSSFTYSQVRSQTDPARSCRVEKAMISPVSTFAGTHWFACGQYRCNPMQNR